ncbi:unnamed protein product [Adineta steineri]|uniref:SSD domain-containing protein n=2 Tax=Adineta steineri TaxID=433720 RepID=A0A818TDU5_9BILA|nr:unnamed protein product [Adineta steineri]
MKQTNRIQMRMDSIRQKTNLQWKQFANIYSRFLIRFSWSILAISSFITIALTVCFLLFMRIRPFDQNDFLMPNGPAMRNAFQLRRIFGNDTELRMHQQLNLNPGLDIIMKRKINTTEKDSNQTNMLSYEIIDEIRLLDQLLQSIRIPYEKDSLEYTYPLLCTKMNHACAIDGNYILTDEFREKLSHLALPENGYYVHLPSGANGIPAFMFGKDYNLTNRKPITDDYEDEDEQENDKHTTAKINIEQPLEKIISYVPVLRLRYTLNTSTPDMYQLAIRWEREALRFLNEEYKSMLIDILPSTSTAIKDTIMKKAHDEGLYMSLVIVIFFILVCFFLSIQGNTHTSVGYLPICGLFSIALSTGATFGILSLFRIQIIEPMALLVFIIAIIDCMRFSIVCGEYHRIIKEQLTTITDVSSEINIESILSSIIETTHPYFMISTLIISIVYVIFSTLSPMLTTTLISLTLVLYILMNYLVHATYFSSCLVITLKRISTRRHSLFCFPLSNDYYTNKTKKSNKFNLLKNKIYSILNNNSIMKTFLSAILCLIFIVFLISSIWFGLSIDTRLFDDEFLPRDAYSLRAHMQSQVDDYDIGPVTMFTIPESINYENEQIKSAMNTLIQQCQNETRANNFKLLWLDHENINVIKTGKEPLKFRITPFSHNDLAVSDGHNHSTITASRFYCQTTSIKGDREDIRTMENMYTYANESPLPDVFPYSMLYASYESLEQIRVEIYLLILLLIICTFISTLIPFISLKNSLLIISHLLALLTGTLTCLYLFHNLTVNFANGLWLYIISIVFLDTLIHTCYNRLSSKWNYNRIIFSLMISLLVLYCYPIQSYVFRIIRNSLMYQSIICLILINFILPSCCYLFRSINKNDEQINKVQIPIVTIIDGSQILTNGTEIKTSTYEISTSINSSI